MKVRPQRINPPDIGRYCDLVGYQEVSELEPGMDFRKPQYRRAVFHAFYQAHLRWRSHPGCVYFLFPWLREYLGWSHEEELWFAYINGCTQHPPTSYLIWKRFPRIDTLDMGELTEWFNANYRLFPWDMDRRHQKAKFLACVQDYRDHLRGGTQREFFDEVGDVPGHRRRVYFNRLWEKVRGEFYSFGRLSTFSYLEYLRIAGLPLDCDNLFLEDMDGSRSHRNGLAKVLGRDDLDWHKSNPRFNGRYDDEQLAWLTEEAGVLLLEATALAADKPWAQDVSYFTLESALCTYKSMHRPNRRYPGVYLDMLHDRIRQTHERWPRDGIEIFWHARRDSVPWYLRQESVPRDPGLAPAKQNHYRLTGQVPVLGREDPRFTSDFDLEIFGKLPVGGECLD